MPAPMVTPGGAVAEADAEAVAIADSDADVEASGIGAGATESADDEAVTGDMVDALLGDAGCGGGALHDQAAPSTATERGKRTRRRFTA